MWINFNIIQYFERANRRCKHAKAPVIYWMKLVGDDPDPPTSAYSSTIYHASTPDTHCLLAACHHIHLPINPFPVDFNYHHNISRQLNDYTNIYSWCSHAKDLFIKKSLGNFPVDDDTNSWTTLVSTWLSFT